MSRVHFLDEDVFVVTEYNGPDMYEDILFITTKEKEANEKIQNIETMAKVLLEHDRKFKIRKATLHERK